MLCIISLFRKLNAQKYMIINVIHTYTTSFIFTCVFQKLFSLNIFSMNFILIVLYKIHMHFNNWRNKTQTHCYILKWIQKLMTDHA